jgi:hypothetical protein
VLALLAAMLPATAQAVLAEIIAVVGFWAAAAVVVFTTLPPFARVRVALTISRRATGVCWRDDETRNARFRAGAIRAGYARRSNNVLLMQIAYDARSRDRKSGRGLVMCLSRRRASRWRSVPGAMTASPLGLAAEWNAQDSAALWLAGLA